MEEEGEPGQLWWIPLSWAMVMVRGSKEAKVRLRWKLVEEPYLQVEELKSILDLQSLKACHLLYHKLLLPPGGPLGPEDPD